MKVGAIVNLGADAESAYVVIGVFANRAQLVYCGSERWYVPEWHPLTDIKPATDNKHRRRAIRWLRKAGFDPDGWRRIDVGRYGAKQTVVVDHEDMRGDAP